MSAALTRIRPMGHIPEHPDVYRKAKSITHLLGGPVPANDVSDLTRFVDAPWSQNGESCTGHAMARLAYMRRWAEAGIQPPAPSPYCAYSLGRWAIDRGATPLKDLGCYPQSVLDGAVEFGTCSAATWTPEPGDINTMPDWTALRQGDEHRIQATGYYRIFTDGLARVMDVRRALTNGFAVEFALMVDQAFERHTGGDIIPRINPAQIVGGHMTTIVGHRPGSMLDLNSWGTDWGMGGYAWLSDDVIASEYASDFYVLTVASS